MLVRDTEVSGERAYGLRRFDFPTAPGSSVTLFLCLLDKVCTPFFLPHLVGSSFHDQGSNLGPLQWRHRVLINNLPGFMVFRILVNTFYKVVEFSFCSSFFFPIMLKELCRKIYFSARHQLLVNLVCLQRQRGCVC